MAQNDAADERAALIERAASTLNLISSRTALFRSLMKPGGKWTTAAMCDGRRHGIIGRGGRITEFGWLCAELAQRSRAARRSGGHNA